MFKILVLDFSNMKRISGLSSREQGREGLMTFVSQAHISFRPLPESHAALSLEILPA